MEKGEEETPNSKRGHTYIQWAFAIIANTLTLSYGLECGWISPTTKILQSDSSPAGEPLSDASIATIASAMGMAAVVGVPIFAFIVGRTGSKSAVILLTIPLTISWGIRIFHCNTTVLLVARIIGGLSAGGIFNLVPQYVREISEDSVRGVLGSLLVLSQNMGIFIMYVLGAYISYYSVIYIAISVPIAGGILMIKAPQSPAYLVKQGKFEESKDAIAFLRGLERDDKTVLIELDKMKKESEEFSSLNSVSFKTMLSDKSWRRGFGLILLVFTFHGANGSFAVLTYASSILVSTGIEITINPELQTLSMPIVMILSSLTLTIIIEKCGRKRLLSGAFFISAISMGMLGAATILQRLGVMVPGWLPILAMTMLVSMYSAGVSPLPYIMMTEMFNFHVRAKVMGVAVTYAWLVSSLQVAIFTPVAATFGQHTAFIIFGVINLIGALIVLFFIPETKGKSDDEIRQDLIKKKKKQNDLPY